MQGWLNLTHWCVCTSTHMQDGTCGAVRGWVVGGSHAPTMWVLGLTSGQQAANDLTGLFIVFEPQLILVHCWLHGCSHRSLGGSSAGRAQNHSVHNLQSQVSHFPSPWDLGNEYPSGWVVFDLPFRRVSKDWYIGTQFWSNRASFSEFSKQKKYS